MKTFPSIMLLAAGLCGANFTARAADTNAPAAAAPAAKKAATLVETEAAEKLLADKKIVVLDVRTADEFAAGHIAGATNLDFRAPDFKAKVAALPKDRVYLVNCAVGGRSARACELMGTLAFPTIYDLKGGIRAWQAAGKPLVK